MKKWMFFRSGGSFTSHYSPSVLLLNQSFEFKMECLPTFQLVEDTPEGSLQCGIWRIFRLTRFYVKSLVISEVDKVSLSRKIWVIQKTNSISTLWIKLLLREIKYYYTDKVYYYLSVSTKEPQTFKTFLLSRLCVYAWLNTMLKLLLKRKNQWFTF